MPVLSIIVPVYNVENYIEECLESLINQTFSDIEILLIDDGSTDNSYQIIKDWEREYPKVIKLYQKENGGLASARNYGLNYAKGEFVAFVDSDDWVSVNIYQKMIDVAYKNNADIVSCNYFHAFREHLEEKNAILDKNIDFLTVPAAWNKLVRRELFCKYNIEYPVGFWYEDLGTSFRLLAVAKKVVYINEALYYYRQDRAGSIMNTKKSEHIYDVYPMIELTYNFLKQNNLLEQHYEELTWLAIQHILALGVKRTLFNEFPNPVKVRKAIKKSYKFMDEYFPDWETNIYYLNDVGGLLKTSAGEKYQKFFNGVRGMFWWAWITRTVLFQLFK